MPIYRNLKAIPELAALSRDERRRIWRTCYGMALQERPTQWAIVGVVGCMAIGWAIGSQTDSTVTGFILGSGLGGSVFGQVAIGQARPHIRRLLNQEANETATSST